MEPRLNEKPTLLSRRVLRTNRVNVTEAAKLKKRLLNVTAAQKLKQQAHSEDIESLKTNLIRIKNVKEKMEVSAMRRKFLADHGIHLNMRDVDMDEFVSAVGENLYSKQTKSSSSLPMENASNSASTIDGRSSTSSLSRGTNGNTALSLHVPIDILTRNNKHRKKEDIIEFVSVHSEDESDDEDEKKTEGSRSFQIARSRPGSSCHGTPIQFRKITPPTSGRRVCEVYKQFEEEEKLVQKLIEKKKFNERIKKEGVHKQHEKFRDRVVNEKCTQSRQFGDHVIGPEIADSSGAGRPENINLTGPENDLELSLEMELNDSNIYPGQEKTHERKIPPEEAARKMYEERDTEDEFEQLMKRSLRISNERKQRPLSVGYLCERGHDKSFGDSKVLARGKCLSACDYSNTQTERQTKMKTNVTENEKKTAWKEIMTPSGEESNKQENGNNVDKSPTSDKWKQLVKKIKQDLNIDSQKTQSALLGRRTSKSQRVSSFDDDIHDTRPSKSVTTGYATMQMTVGKKVVSIYVPRFKNDVVCKSQKTGRANVKSCFEVEQVRQRREMQRRTKSFTLE